MLARIRPRRHRSHRRLDTERELCTRKHTYTHVLINSHRTSDKLEQRHSVCNRKCGQCLCDTRSSIPGDVANGKEHAPAPGGCGIASVPALATTQHTLESVASAQARATLAIGQKRATALDSVMAMETMMVNDAGNGRNRRRVCKRPAVAEVGLTTTTAGTKVHEQTDEEEQGELGGPCTPMRTRKTASAVSCSQREQNICTRMST